MVIFTSHNLDTVIEMCDRVCVLENGEVKAILDLHDDTVDNGQRLKELMR